MLQNKEKLTKELREVCESYIGDKMTNVYNELYHKYAIPFSVSSDIITLRTDMDSYSDFVLFCIADVLDRIGPDKEKDVSSHNFIKRYYTDVEIKEYSKKGYKTTKFKFPYTINNMVQISEDQWIGKFSVRQLMELKNAQLISYNENIQRNLKKVIKDEQEYWKIYLNKNAVNQIEDAFKRGVYIPNTITLAMPESGTKFLYNGNQIEIQKIDHFDIIDGYHRYIAVSKIYDENNDFDYPLELRIVLFPEYKAQQFIFQEDQKTKMRKVDSNALNQNNAGSRVANRLNTDPSSDYQGLIQRNEGAIDLGDFVALINYFFFKTKKQNDMDEIISIANTIKGKLNLMREKCTFDTRHIKHNQLPIICYLFTKEMNPNNLVKALNKIMKEIEDIPSNYMFYSDRPKKKLLEEIDRRVGEFYV